MENIEYAIAYSEVLEILKYIPTEDYNKIPKSKIELFENNADKEYKFKYNPNITLNEQNVSKRAKAIIAILFRDYWATETQRKKIIAKQKYDRFQMEKDKESKYNPDNLFKNKISKVETEITENTVAMVEYQESIFTKIKNWFKRTLTLSSKVCNFF